jgi:precorrin-2/cobalt-factor-2 C20-methyltransferase
MLYGIGLGPGDKELLTLKAVRIIKEVDEVIVPGKLAYGLISDIREPRIVEFPMGKSEEVSKELGEELAERCEDEDVAFCCLGDPVFYSTFQHVVEVVKEHNSRIRIEIIPGITSFTASFSKLGLFVDRPMLVTTPGDGKVDTVAILKATKPRSIAENYPDFKFYMVERMYMDAERILTEMPEKADYFTVLIGKRRWRF